MKFRLVTAAAAVTASTFAASGAAFAAHDTNPSDRVDSYAYALTAVQSSSVPNAAASGTTRITTLPNGKIRVQVTADGLAPGLPHAMHLHGVDGAATDNGCPGPGADTDGDGFVSVPEGGPFYGGILTSLTTTGDTTASSALALDRYAVADETGHLSYSRTFRNDSGLANADTVQVVVHGVDVDGDGTYSLTDAGEAPLVPGSGIPFSATMPALCGGIAN
ncbi:hypothetical protein [Janibacter anophelis]|uniref:hypothetical protein n=1 Tax=Janibacter anophelis TaxID=319054 RepID=UPI00082F4BC3|nr:hypothetical protein [Janibacter anophelis]